MNRIVSTALAMAIVAALSEPSAAVVRDVQPPLKGNAEVAKAPAYDRFIVKFRDSELETRTTAARQRSLELAAAGRGLKARVLRRTSLGSEVLSLDKRLGPVEARAFMDQVRLDPMVEYIEPDLRMKPAYTPNDPLYSQQWHYNDPVGGISLSTAQDISRGSGVVVAVLDTGYTNHPDLDGNRVPGYDFISDIATANDGNGRDSNPYDPGDWVAVDECGEGEEADDSSWHGTHVAGTIAAVTNNGLGVAGVAPLAKVQPVRVLGKCGGYTSDIADAIVWASGGVVSGVPANANPAEVINMSLGGEGACSVTYQTAINSAVARGSVVVVAAGNSNSSVELHTPANCQNVVAVASSDLDGTRSSFSNAGAGIDITAPGGGGINGNGDSVGIASTADSGTTAPEAPGYFFYQGTSMAAPHVAGVVALMQSLSPNTPARVEEILKLTANPIAPFDCPGTCGAGKLNAFAALRGVQGTFPRPPFIVLRNNVWETVASSPAGSQIRYSLPNFGGSKNLNFRLRNGSGNADLYVKFGSPPSLSDYDCRSNTAGNEEICTFEAPVLGNYYVMVHGASAHSGVEILASHYARLFLNRDDYAIPDLGVTQSPIVVRRRPGYASTRTLVRVEIPHTYRGDLKLELIGPSGRVFPLQQSSADANPDIVREFRVDASSELRNGIWHLRVTDEGPADVGHINSWQMRL